MTTTTLERPVAEHPAAGTDVRFDPVTPLIGAEVTGVDLRQELDAETVATLRRGLLEHKVLFFRDQKITDRDQIRFTRYFGPVTPAHPVSNGLVDQPEIKQNVLSKSGAEYRASGPTLEKPTRGFRRRNGGWHIDITFVANPADISFLRGIEIPAVGGDTLWTNLEAVYDSLSPALQALVNGLQAIHSIDAGTPGNARPERFDGRSPGPFAALHPLVRVHPETGRKSLFLAGGFTQAIHGLNPRESDALLDFLNAEIATRQDLQVRFRWTPNALAVWDNRSTTHAGPIDGPLIKGERIVHRTTVGGELPKGPDGFVSRSLAGELFNTIS
jgi:alpha-ketoglutarate-dependent sulfate ester dioxygenase